MKEEKLQERKLKRREKGVWAVEDTRLPNSVEKIWIFHFSSPLMNFTVLYRGPGAVDTISYYYSNKKNEKP